ncbi:DUF1330 domain-containing protein [Aquisalimonas sp. 2447]|uniref:DUF1330 domain-containing protein n=1 Tax=Aquisalimonas sp. 2447 TaxID=2740807 RepID=UPI001432646F|nr:DUF1330 domain-containing protein [Aquisalimonas sp. 2447]QIT56147.1 DUF1330 domain-containing protein [Aquisalimonas sp. 2447]
MSAYVIGHVTVRDQEAWAAYRARVPDTLAPWFGELLFRGHLAEVLAGDHPHRAVVALKFPTAREARGWHDSAAYQALLPLRDRAADVTLLRFDGDESSGAD